MTWDGHRIRRSVPRMTRSATTTRTRQARPARPPRHRTQPVVRALPIGRCRREAVNLSAPGAGKCPGESSRTRKRSQRAIRCLPDLPASLTIEGQTLKPARRSRTESRGPATEPILPPPYPAPPWQCPAATRVPRRTPTKHANCGKKSSLRSARRAGLRTSGQRGVLRRKCLHKTRSRNKLSEFQFHRTGIRSRISPSFFCVRPAET